MSKHYKHSDSMGVLKSVTEKLQDNHSSSQYVSVLDTMLLNAISPILQCCNFADSYVSGVLHHTAANGRRKVSNSGRFNFLARAMLFLSVPSQKKTPVYRSLRLERNITFIIVKDFLDECENYYDFKSKEVREKTLEIEHRIGYFGGADLSSAIRATKYWFTAYCNFRNAVLEKYMRLITLQAQKFYQQNNSNIDLDDLLQNYILFASKAIDKFDHRQGTLTSYILNWLNHARNVTASHENGTAFVLPPNKRRACTVNNIGVPLDDSSVKEIEVDSITTVEDAASIERVRRLARLADPHGYARLSLGIEEYLYPSEIRSLTKFRLSA